MSARFIDEYASGAWVTEHVIIEANAEVAAAARRFAETARVQTTVLEGFWQEAVLTLQPGSFAGVLFDTFPLRGSGQEYGEFSGSFYPAAARLLEAGGRFTFYFDEGESCLLGDDVARRLHAAGFVDVDSEEVMCEAPPDCEYFSNDRFVAPVCTRGNAPHMDWPQVGQLD